ncbi:MAG: DUF3887 domain-containing protein [Dorea sp.]|nr:DUF3887 domain-containing protein [Dorea sp.]
MKKKISLLICMLTAVLAFTTGCSRGKEELEYDEAMVSQVADYIFNYFPNYDDTAVEQIKNLRNFAFEQQLTEMGLPITPEAYISAIDSWKAGEEECGAYVSHGDYTFEADGDELVVSTETEFENRMASVEFVFDENLYLDSLTVSARFTMGEILQKAGLNTLLGMGTVFVVLIIISLIISLFKYIPAIQDKFSKKPEAVQVPAQAPAAPVIPEKKTVVPKTDDSELIAVIAAAIAAAEGTTTDGFVVRSIKRRKSNKWN